MQTIYDIDPVIVACWNYVAAANRGDLVAMRNIRDMMRRDFGRRGIDAINLTLDGLIELELDHERKISGCIE